MLVASLHLAQPRGGPRTRRSSTGDWSAEWTSWFGPRALQGAENGSVVRGLGSFEEAPHFRAPDRETCGLGVGHSLTLMRV